MRRRLAIAAFAALGGLALADQCQVARLVTPEAHDANSFGVGVASTGDYWFVSDHQAEVFCSGFGCGVGAVYVYEMVAGELLHSQTLISPFAQSPDNFGVSIGASGDTLAVSARNSAVPSGSGRPGAIFMYTLMDGSWDLTSIIEPPVGVQDFTDVLSFDGRTLAAFDYFNERVLVYTLAAEGWELTDELLPPDGVRERSEFGWTILVAGNRIIVGAPRDGAVANDGGSFHVYSEVAEGQYELEQSVVSTEPQQLGRSLALVGETLLVGAPVAERTRYQQGAVHVYRFDGDSWIHVDELLSPNPHTQEGFGWNLTADGENMAIRGGSGGLYRAHLFEQGGDGEWRFSETLTPDTSALPDQFGFAMEMHGSELVVSAYRERDAGGSDRYGAAYHFDLSCGACETDLDADGRLTIFDFLLFFNLFDDGDTQADFDGDGELTIFDFLAFQTAFDAGCE